MSYAPYSPLLTLVGLLIQTWLLYFGKLGGGYVTPSCSKWFSNLSTWKSRLRCCAFPNVRGVFQNVCINHLEWGGIAAQMATTYRPPCMLIISWPRLQVLTKGAVLVKRFRVNAVRWMAFQLLMFSSTDFSILYICIYCTIFIRILRWPLIKI